VETPKNRLLVAGVGEWVISNSPEAVLATYALGSCVGVSLWDPRTGFGGLLHFMLPESTLNEEKARFKPGTFCDSGIQGVLSELQAAGADMRCLQIYVAGGAKVLHGSDFFDIGRRNALAARRRLWEKGLSPMDEDTGGEMSRTMKLYLDSGRVTVRDSFGERELGRGLFTRS
jgi:chemotaxis protein CheD